MKQTKEHYPLENKHSEKGNICCQGCYRLGIQEGKAQAEKAEVEFLETLLNEKRLVANTYLGKFIKRRIERLKW